MVRVRRERFVDQRRQITDLGCMSQSLYSVSLYETLGPETTEFIINHASLPCVVTSITHIPTLLRIRPRVPGLKFIVTVESLEPPENEIQEISKKALLSSLASEAGIQILSMAEVESIGAAAGRAYNPPQPDDFVTINYTSGTTGMPKGVVLTHRNAVAAATASLAGTYVDERDIFASYLPAAHIYERMMEQLAFWGGSKVCLYPPIIDLRLTLPDRLLPRQRPRTG